MKNMDVSAEFRDQSPTLVRLVSEFCAAFEVPGLTPVRSKKRDGSPGDTVKFMLAVAKASLFSLQFYPNPFLQMKWSRSTLRKVGLEKQLRDVLRKEVSPLCSGSHLDEETPTEFRVVIRTGDASKAVAIIEKLRPIMGAVVGVLPAGRFPEKGKNA